MSVETLSCWSFIVWATVKSMLEGAVILRQSSIPSGEREKTPNCFILFYVEIRDKRRPYRPFNSNAPPKNADGSSVFTTKLKQEYD